MFKMIVNRKKFLKGIGALALLPIFPFSSIAREEKNEISVTSMHRILCCNIRVALLEDEVKGVGWPQRKELCIKVIKKQKPDIICLQEVLKVQAEDFRNAFPGYMLLGFDGPEMDAHKEGYHGIAKNPILFKTDRYELLNAGNYWLSETPLIAGSKSWDTARARNANWVRLKDRKTNKDFRVINLHLDHISDKARAAQTQMVVNESMQYQKEFPQILTGDFNASIESQVFNSIKMNGWIDSFKSFIRNDSPIFTYHAFEGRNYSKGDPLRKIDYIFSKGNIQSLSSKIIRDHDQGRYPSDHFFLSADFKLT